MQGEEPENHQSAKRSNFKSRRALAKILAEEEIWQWNEAEAEAESHYSYWLRITKIIGAAFVIDTLVPIPMLAGFPLHFLWFSVGKYLVLLWAALATGLFYAAVVASSGRKYLKELREINRRSPPPGSPYRKALGKGQRDNLP